MKHTELENILQFRIKKWNEQVEEKVRVEVCGICARNKTGGNEGNLARREMNVYTTGWEWVGAWNET